MKPLRSPAAILASVLNCLLSSHCLSYPECSSPQVSNAYQEGEDRESRCQQPTGQSILELAVLKRLDSPHHAHSLGEGSDTESRPLVLLSVLA